MSAPLTILFYPEPLVPKPRSRVYVTCEDYGINYHNNPEEPYDVHMYWSYHKHSIKPDELTLNDPRCLNSGCWDVSKDKVSEIFNDIRIDPLVHSGMYVEKLDKQGAHHGHRVVSGPMDPRSGYIYQRYIEDIEDGLFVKYGIYYHKEISIIVKSYKPAPFNSKYVKHEIVDKGLFFSPLDEVEFNNKCKLFGVDYACIEFLNDNGTPVIIDVNNVMGGGTVSALTGTEIERKINMLFVLFMYHEALL